MLSYKLSVCCLGNVALLACVACFCLPRDLNLGANECVLLVCRQGEEVATSVDIVCMVRQASVERGWRGGGASVYRHCCVR